MHVSHYPFLSVYTSSGSGICKEDGKIAVFSASYPQRYFQPQRSSTPFSMPSSYAFINLPRWLQNYRLLEKSMILASVVRASLLAPCCSDETIPERVGEEEQRQGTPKGRFCWRLGFCNCLYCSAVGSCDLLRGVGPLRTHNTLILGSSPSCPIFLRMQ